jgi:hypothetical protein
VTHEKSWIRIISSPNGTAYSELQAHRDGAVGVHFWSDGYQGFEPLEYVLSGGHVPAAVDAIHRTLKLVGATGRTRITFSVSRARKHLPGHNVEIGRWWDEAAAPDEAQIDGALRDLRRSAEQFVPEPDDEGAT